MECLWVAMVFQSALLAEVSVVRGEDIGSNVCWERKVVGALAVIVSLFPLNSGVVMGIKELSVEICAQQTW